MTPTDLRALVHDNTSGAREIAERSLQLLQRAATASTATAPGALLDELADVAVKVVRSKPEMAPVYQALNRALAEAEARETEAGDVGPFRLELLALLQAHVDGLKSSLERAAANAQPLLPNGSVLLTHSRSSTVLAALKHAKADGKVFDVLVTEGRPNLEGRSVARELAQDHIPMRFVVDAMAATAVEGADRVLLGADAVTPHGVVNKVGSRLLALAARDAGIPVTVLAESSKAWTRRLDPEVSLLTARPREPREVWDGSPYGVEVVNLYFERIPLALVSEIVDEEGVHAPTDYWSGVRSRGHARRFAQAFPGELD